MRFTILGSGIFVVTLLIGSVPLLFLGNSRLSCEQMADGDGSCHLVNGYPFELTSLEQVSVRTAIT